MSRTECILTPWSAKILMTWHDEQRTCGNFLMVPRAYPTQHDTWHASQKLAINNKHQQSISYTSKQLSLSLSLSWFLCLYLLSDSWVMASRFYHISTVHASMVSSRPQFYSFQTFYRGEDTCLTTTKFIATPYATHADQSLHTWSDQDLLTLHHLSNSQRRNLPPTSQPTNPNTNVLAKTLYKIPTNNDYTSLYIHHTDQNS